MPRLLALICALVLAFGSAAPSPLAAQDRSERVTFARGETGTTLRGRIQGREGASYILGAQAGQRLSVDMSATNGSAFFNVTRRGAPEALFNGSVQGNSFSGILPASGDWVVQVYLMRNAARRGESANFTLSVSISGRALPPPPPPPPPGSDFADGDAGGPDWWVVAGVAANDTLNVRQGPSTRDAVIARVANGTVLRNDGGCVTQGSTRWCRVGDADRRFAGWVAGRFLRESAGPVAALPPSRGAMPGICRREVAARFDLPVSSLTAYPAQTAGRGYEVYAESNVTTRAFNCTFDSRGNLTRID